MLNPNSRVWLVFAGQAGLAVFQLVSGNVPVGVTTLVAAVGTVVAALHPNK